MINDLPLLQCINLTKWYKRANFSVEVLNNITLNIYSREIISIIGISGSGKSTLLHLLSGLDVPTTGEVFFAGQSLSKLSDHQSSMIRNRSMGFVYQFHHLLPDFNVLENVAMPLLIGGLNRCFAQNRAKYILELVGLEDRIYYYPYELSGGESQRVAIARAIVSRPTLVLADEPTGNLDQKNSNRIFQLLKNINALYGTTIIIATHDLILAKQCHKILTIFNSSIKFT